MSVQRSTRSGSQSLPFTLEDVSQLILRSEERVLSKLDDIVTRISALENRFEVIHTEQIRQRVELDSMKDIIVRQQLQLEKNDRDQRLLNLVFSGIPEYTIEMEDGDFSDDLSKVEYLCNEITEMFDPNDIVSCARLGKSRDGQNRLLHVKFSNLKSRNDIFHNQKKIRENLTCKRKFGVVYINNDMSVLMRKEDKRLRETMKTLKSTAQSTDKIFIRGGKLYKNSMIVDKIDIASQLF